MRSMGGMVYSRAIASALRGLSMFVLNEGHRQGQIFTTIDGLPRHLAKRLEEGWAAVFYREYFCRIDEQPYMVLYSDKDSRPNIPVNVLVGLEALKSAFNWSDEEMYDAFCFDLQVRRAVGYCNLHEGQFDLRTVYNFRRRLSKHMQESGENLIEQSFEKATDEQIEVFRLKTGKVRMDSTDIASNIRNMSRLHLLVEVVQRVHRMLGENDRALYADAFAPYMKGSSGQYVYRVKSADGPAHMQRIGELMREMLEKLADAYGKHATYRMLGRVFAEHFLVEQSRLRLKVGKELSARSLNSPDDPEATYRKKNNRPHKGYVANVTETCDPSNPLQLIVLVQTKPNATNDDDMLVEAVPSLKRRLGVNEMNTDGAYNSDESFKVLRDNGIKLIQTAIRGHSPHEHLGLDRFEIVISSPANAPDANLTSESESNGANEPDAASKSAEANESDAAGEPQVSTVPEAANKSAETNEPEAAGEPHATNATSATVEILATSECASTAQACPMTITCPHGQTVELESVESKTEYKRYRAHFDEGRCASCPFKDKCLARETKTKRWRTLSFDERDVEIARRRRRIAQDHESGTNLRVAIESTIASLKQPFNYDQLPVRGAFRVAMTLIGCAAVANVRRIHRHLSRQGAPDGASVEGTGRQGAEDTSFLFFLRSVSHILRFLNGSQAQAYAN